MARLHVVSCLVRSDMLTTVLETLAGADGISELRVHEQAHKTRTASVGTRKTAAAKPKRSRPPRRSFSGASVAEHGAKVVNFMRSDKSRTEYHRTDLFHVAERLGLQEGSIQPLLTHLVRDGILERTRVGHYSVAAKQED